METQDQNMKHAASACVRHAWAVRRASLASMDVHEYLAGVRSVAEKHAIEKKMEIDRKKTNPVGNAPVSEGCSVGDNSE